ncbi:MAG: 16S rRNA processing protein RimM [Firmicutes bacterium]|nr:16S rRNA processing protein RimM [Bacillota bacterium]
MEYYRIGYIANTLGIAGELKVQVLTNDIARFSSLEFCFIDMGKEKERVEIQYYREYKKGYIIIKFRGLDTISETEKFKGRYMVVDEDNLAQLEEGHYYIFQILGCRVKTEEGEELGEVTDVLQPGGNDVYVVRGREKEILVPAVKQFVKDIDIKRKVITVDLPEGLIE